MSTGSKAYQVKPTFIGASRVPYPVSSRPDRSLASNQTIRTSLRVVQPLREEIDRPVVHREFVTTSSSGKKNTFSVPPRVGQGGKDGVHLQGLRRHVGIVVDADDDGHIRQFVGREVLEHPGARTSFGATSSTTKS